MEKRIELERRGKQPNEIADLNLDNAKAILIEGLTDEYTALESLSMINVGLTSMKGFPKLPELRKLELSDNRISSGLACLQHCPKLNQLNVSGNKIKDLEALEPLKTLEDLTHLDLFNNPLSNDETDFRSKVFKMLPKLKYLDGTDVNDEEDEEDEGDYEEPDVGSSSMNPMHSAGGKNGAPAGYGEQDDDEEDGDEEEDLEEDDEDAGEEGGDVEEVEDEEDDDDDDGGEDGPGLSALYNDNIEEGDEEDGDFEEGGEEGEDDDEEIEEEEESEAPGGKRRKTDADEAAAADDA